MFQNRVVFRQYAVLVIAEETIKDNSDCANSLASVVRRSLMGLFVESMDIVDLEEAEFLQYCLIDDCPSRIKAGYLDYEIPAADDENWLTEKTDDGLCTYSSESLDSTLEDVYRMRRDLLDRWH